MVDAFAYGDTALVERFVDGAEVAVPVVDTGTGPRALPAVAIQPDGGVYDYSARYTAGSTEFVVPAKLDDELAAECARVAVAAHEALGLRHLSRTRPDHRRRRARVVPRGQRRPRAHRDLDGAAGRRRRPGSTWGP